MADYRLSAKVISRGNGQSSVASAAYRAAARLHDIRTGETHDYTRKQGVVHSTILAPDNAPEWMCDRAQLWPAVEAAEKRKDAQLAREVQLSLPHELTADQRRELVEDFVREQFVQKGMIADLAIHAPGKDGDDRNHHAHVMLTMRSLTGEGFGQKVREWNDQDVLKQWREQWAHHQNRMLEKHGHEARVNHRSLGEQGIDREPTQHLGPVAHDMEQNGKPSRIGEENRAIEERNTDRAIEHQSAVIISLEIEREKRLYAKWSQRAAMQSESAKKLAELDQQRKRDQVHATLRINLDRELQAQFGQHKATIAKELAAVERRLQATGLHRLAREILGRQRSDEKHRQDLAATLQSIKQREQEQRSALEQRLAAEKTKKQEPERERRDVIEQDFEKARAQRQGERWKPLRGKDRMTPPREGANAPTALKTPERAAKPRSTSYPAPRLKPTGYPEPAQRKTTRDPNEVAAEQHSFQQRATKSDQAPPAADPARAGRPTISAPWESAAFGSKRPWESDLFSNEPANDRGRERAPDTDAPKFEKP